MPDVAAVKTVWTLGALGTVFASVRLRRLVGGEYADWILILAFRHHHSGISHLPVHDSAALARSRVLDPLSASPPDARTRIPFRNRVRAALFFPQLAGDRVG